MSSIHIITCEVTSYENKIKILVDRHTCSYIVTIDIYTFFIISEKSAFEYGLVNQALSAAMRTLIKVGHHILTHQNTSFVYNYVYDIL